jgi:hypothetical protein
MFFGFGFGVPFAPRSVSPGGGGGDPGAADRVVQGGDPVIQGGDPVIFTPPE